MVVGREGNLRTAVVGKKQGDDEKAVGEEDEEKLEGFANNINTIDSFLLVLLNSAPKMNSLNFSPV